MGKGSTRDVMRQSDIHVISSKKLNKTALTSSSSSYKMDKSDCCTKRLNLSNKVLDDWHTVNLESVPRKLRSVLQKRRNEYVSQSFTTLTNRIHRLKWPLEDCNKKLKVDRDEQQHNSIRVVSILEKITKDEEEAILGLLTLVERYPGNNKTNEINLNDEVSEEVNYSKPEDLVKKCVQIDVNVKKDYKDVTDGNNSRKRCSSHVYICQIIVDLQIKEGKKLNSLNEAKTDITPENISNGNAGINLNEASMVSKTLFQDKAHASGLQSYFGNPLCDPSQWSKPMSPKQQMWMNPFIAGAASYQNWQNGRRETVPPLSGKYMQDVLVSKQQVPFKMQFGHCSSVYEENGGFTPTLKLTL